MTNLVLDDSEIAALDTLGAEIGIPDLTAVFQMQARILDFYKPQLSEKNVIPLILAQTNFPGASGICEKVTMRGPILQQPDEAARRTLSFRLHVERTCTKNGEPSEMNLLIFWFKKAATEPALKNMHIDMAYTVQGLAIMPKSESPVIQKLVEMTFRKGSFPHIWVDAATDLNLEYK